MYRLREVKRGTYDDRGYSNEETIANLAITKAAEINNVLTYTYGYDDDVILLPRNGYTITSLW